MVITRKKLIEVGLPLDAINKASAREKSIRHGHPSTLHLWWARRPLAAARAVIFSQMVDDPSAYVDVLRTNPELKRKAEADLVARLELYEEARTLAAKAKEAGLPVTEPGQAPTLDDVLAGQERQRLFRIIEELVKWESTTNETVLQAAREEILQSWRRTCTENADHPQAKELFDRHVLPAFHDPFAGGGALPLEAQRLGMESYASDLNPVAVLINKAMIEIPPKFAGKPPVNPEAREDERKRSIPSEWKGAQGLAEDVRYYGQWMRDEAEKRIGHLYPKVEVTAEMGEERPDLKEYTGKKLTVIAWLWARTVKSPNPAFAQVDVPLASTFMLSTKARKEAYVEPVIENGGYRFTVKVGKPEDPERAKNGTKIGRGGNFQCLMSGTPIPVAAIREQGLAGTLGARLMAIVAEGVKGRLYLTPTLEHEVSAKAANPTWAPELEINHNQRDIRTQLYGLTTYGDLFTRRQLVALTTFSDLVQEAREQIRHDALAVGLLDDGKSLSLGGIGTSAYSDAVGMYLGIGVSKLTDYNATLVQWSKGRDQAVHVFGRQALPMVWDYAEVSPFAGAAGDLTVSLEGIAKSTESHISTTGSGLVANLDAQTQTVSSDKCISTDPPYYDNIGYADLSDYFYVWLRRSLNPVFPELFSTLAVPKAEELVATPYRHGNKEKAETFFLDGMTQAMHQLADQAHPAFPVTIYYAFKQSESDGADGTTNTGWDTFLAAVIEAGFAISGTWPMRTEREGRMVSNNTNSLASSIVLVCRKRPVDAPTVTRREFVATLKSELLQAIAHLQASNIAPVDLAQAAIGPGMQVYTRYAQVLNAEGKPLTVREALALINQTLDEALAEQEGDFDGNSRWALTWFEESRFGEGEYGIAEQLSKSKNTSVAGMVVSGILESSRGKVRLFRPDELPENWDPATDTRTPAWESVHQLVRAMDEGGDSAAAELMSKLGTGRSEVARDLAYRLYTMCERKGWAKEALWYNSLVQSWPELTRLSQTEQRAWQGTLI